MQRNVVYPTTELPLVQPTPLCRPTYSGYYWDRTYRMSTYMAAGIWPRNGKTATIWGYIAPTTVNKISLQIYLLTLSNALLWSGLWHISCKKLSSRYFSLNLILCSSKLTIETTLKSDAFRYQNRQPITIHHLSYSYGLIMKLICYIWHILMSKYMFFAGVPVEHKIESSRLAARFDWWPVRWCIFVSCIHYLLTYFHFQTASRHQFDAHIQYNIVSGE